MCFPDFPFDEKLPSFPHHSDVLVYLNQYAKEHKLHQFIHFNTKVELVEPVQRKATRIEDNGGDIDGERSGIGFTDTVKWRIDVLELKTGVKASEIFDAVLICSG